MLKKLIIITTITISIILAIFDFFLFETFPQTAFYVYNILALLVGIIFLIIGYKLLTNRPNNKIIPYLSLLAGFAMTIIHITKIAIGNCI